MGGAGAISEGPAPPLLGVTRAVVSRVLNRGCFAYRDDVLRIKSIVDTGQGVLPKTIVDSRMCDEFHSRDR